MPETIEVGLPIGDRDVGEEISLFVIVNTGATSPVLYQWYKNNVAIPGAVDSIYQLVITASDRYASFTVSVVNPCGDDVSPPSVVGEIDVPLLPPETLYTGTVTDGFYEGTNHLITTNPDNSVILFNYRGFGGIVKTTDAGATWVWKDVTRSFNKDYNIQAMSYDTVQGEFWVSPYRNQIRETEFEYSNDGWETSTWWNSDGHAGWSGTYAHGWLINEGEDNIYFADADSSWTTNNISIFRQKKPAQTAGAGCRTIGQFDNAYLKARTANTSSWCHLRLGSDNMVCYGIQGQTPTNVHFYPNNFVNGQGGTGGMGEPALASIVNGKFVESNDVDLALAWRSSVGGIVTLDRITSGIYIAPWPTMTVDFGVDVEHITIGYGSGEWVITAVQVADNTKLMAAKSLDDTLTWTIAEHAITVSLDSTLEYRQLEHIAVGDYWLLAQPTELSPGVHSMNLIKFYT